MRTRVKICCIASVEEAAIAIRHGADAIGLVGAMPSGPGPIDNGTIATITAIAPPPVATFLLTAETDADAIAAHIAATGASTVQIVSHIDPGQSARLASLMPVTRRVQVIHVEGTGALDRIQAYAPYVHAFLLDSGRPGLSVPELGGTGRAHDWSVSAEFVRRSVRPVFLAGGLNSTNIGEAIGSVRPYGVDLCTGVRTAGSLDEGKLIEFMAAVRVADSARAKGVAEAQ